MNQMYSPNRLVSVSDPRRDFLSEILRWEAGNRFLSFSDSNYSGEMGSRTGLRDISNSCSDKLVLDVVRADPSFALYHRYGMAVFDDLSNGPFRRSVAAR